MTDLSQIVITRVEEPTDEPRGEVYKIHLFDGKECIETFYTGDENAALNFVDDYLKDLRSQ